MITRAKPYDPREHGCRCDECVLGPRGPVNETDWRPVPPEIRKGRALVGIVGELPWWSEHGAGRPFAGASGDYLDGAFAKVLVPKEDGSGLRPARRSDCTITNCGMCKPHLTDMDAVRALAKGHKMLDPIAACGGVARLAEELRGLRVIIPVGATALKVVTGLVGISKYRGCPADVGVAWKGDDAEEKRRLFRARARAPIALPAYHPAHMLRQQRILDGVFIGDVQKAFDFAVGRRTVQTWKFKIAPTFEEARAFLKAAAHEKEIAFDTETTTGDPLHSDLLCYSVAARSAGTMCIPFLKDNGKKGKLRAKDEYWPAAHKAEIVRLTRRLLESKRIAKVLQNLRYDDAVCRVHGLGAMAGSLWDTMYMRKTLFPELPIGLAFLLSVYTDAQNHKYMVKEGAKDTKGSRKFTRVADPILWEYNCYDSGCLFEIKDKVLAELRAAGLLDVYLNDMRLTDVARRMQERGLSVDEERRGVLRVEMTRVIRNSLASLRYLSETPKLRPNATKELAKALFNKLGAPIVARTKKGAPSTDKASLALILATGGCPKRARLLIRALLNYRKALKLRSTYLDGLHLYAGRVHPSWRAAILKTPRWRCVAAGTLVETCLPLSDFVVSDNTKATGGTETEVAWETIGTPIERIRRGDLVWCCGSGGEVARRCVLRAQEMGVRSVVRVEWLSFESGILRLKNGALANVAGAVDGYVDLTPDHEVMLAPGVYCRADALRAGDRVRGLTRGFSRCALTVARAPQRIGRVPVYDLEVEEHHNFIAGGVVVKNCSDPNIQNIPKKSKRKDEVLRECNFREMYVARPGYTFVVGDVSKQELRIIAILAKAKKLLAALNDPTRNVHAEYTSRLFKVPLEVAKDVPQYDLWKNSVFAWAYGAEWTTVYELLRTFIPDVDPREIRALFNRLPNEIPEVPIWWRDLEREIRERSESGDRWPQLVGDVQGHVRNICGGFLDNRQEIYNWKVQCVPSFVRVITADGYLPIGELVGRQFRVWTGSNWAPATAIRMGVGKLLEVRTGRGLALVCDEEHKFRVPGRTTYEWRAAKDLNPGQRVAIDLASEHEFGEDGDVEDAYHLGVWVGDGSSSVRRDIQRRRDGSVRLPLERDVALALTIGNAKGTGDARRGGAFAVQRAVQWMKSRGMRPSIRVGEGCKTVWAYAGGQHWLRAWGADPEWKAHTKRIPERIWRSSLAVRKAFLHGVLNADGFWQEGCVGIRLCQRRLLDELALLFRTVGVDVLGIWGPYDTGDGVHTAFILKLSMALVYAAMGWGDRCPDRMRMSAVDASPKFVCRAAADKLDPTCHSDQVIQSRLRTVPNATTSPYVLRRMGIDGLHDHANVTAVTRRPIVVPLYTLMVDHPDHSYVADGFVSKNCYAAEFTNECNLRIDDVIQRKGWDVHQVLQVHDELGFEVRDEPRLIRTFARELQDTFVRRSLALKCPTIFHLDMKVGRAWTRGEELDVPVPEKAWEAARKIARALPDVCADVCARWG